MQRGPKSGRVKDRLSVQRLRHGDEKYFANALAPWVRTCTVSG
jgi:hypothetical protein